MSKSSGGSDRSSPCEERRIREAALDRTIADSFPASDPPSTIPNPADETELEPIRRDTDDPPPGDRTPR